MGEEAANQSTFSSISARNFEFSPECVPRTVRSPTINPEVTSNAHVSSE